MKGLAKPDVDLNDPAVVDAYDELPLWSAFAGQLLFRHLRLLRSESVLDVGCGTGFPAIELAERLGRGSKVVGLDTWAEALQRAEAKAASREVRNVSFVNGNACAMPFADRTFDLIVSNLGINNFDDPLIALREGRRVAKPEGRLAVTSNRRGHFDEFYSIFESVVDESIRPALRQHIDHRATTERLRTLAEQSGFAVLQIEEETVQMRFADGSAFLDHSFIRLGFFPAWRDLVPPEHREETFRRLEAALDSEARARDGFTVTVPLVYLEAVAVD